MSGVGRPRNMTVEERFWEKVRKTKTCWLWTGGVTHQEYGRFAITSTRADVRLVLPHRYAWELRYGPIPPGLSVLHACDTPRCVRVSHLMLGSPRANMIDASLKGRLKRKPAA